VKACDACGRACPPGERLCIAHQQLHRDASRTVELADEELDMLER
jgi:hypothetical protein